MSSVWLSKNFASQASTATLSAMQVPFPYKPVKIFLIERLEAERFTAVSDCCGAVWSCSSNDKCKMEKVALKDLAEPNFLLHQMLRLFCPGLHYIFQVIELPALVLLFHFVLLLFSSVSGSED